MTDSNRLKIYSNIVAFDNVLPEKFVVTDSHQADVFVLDALDDALSDYITNHLDKPVVFYSDKPFGFNQAHSEEELKSLLLQAESQVKRVNTISQISLEAARKHPWLRLLLFMYATNKPLKPYYNHSLDLGYAYSMPVVLESILGSLEELSRLKLVQSAFFDNAYACPKCQSLAVMMRDGCTNCNGVNLIEQPLIHHFPCSFQATEEQFLQSVGVYSCPKCHKILKQIGLDYDKPGRETVCQSCKHSSSETIVLGRCLSCQDEFQVEDFQKRTLYQYQLNDLGVNAVFEGEIQGVRFKDYIQEKIFIEKTDVFFSLIKKMKALEKRGLINSVILKIDLDKIEQNLPSNEKIPFYRTLSKEIIETLRETDSLWLEKNQIYLLLCHCQVKDTKVIEKRVLSVLERVLASTIGDNIKFSTLELDSFVLDDNNA